MIVTLERTALYCIAKQEANKKDTNNRSNNKQRLTALEWTAAEASGGFN